MYKILFCSDLHGNKELYEKLFEIAGKDKEIRAIIIGGDICPHFRGPLELGIKVEREFMTDYLIPKLKLFGKETSKEVLLMMGNDDLAVNMDVLEKAEKDGILKLINSNVKKIDNFNLIGYSFVSPHPFLLKDWEKPDYDESEILIDESRAVRSIKKIEGTIKEDMSKIKKLSDPKKTIYVMHAPPFDTKLDASFYSRHFGSKAIKEFIKQEQPPLTLHGHIHEAPQHGSWKDKIGKTICLNPGSEHLNSRLNYAVIDLDDLYKVKHFSE